MKIIAILWFCCFTHATSFPEQAIQVKSVTSRTVYVTKQSRLEHELTRFLVWNHEADRLSDSQALFKVPLLVTTKRSDIGVYKFGMASAHTGYNVVFQYRNKLVFSSALSSGPLLVHLQQFLTHYPNLFSVQSQRIARAQLTAIVEHNKSAGESDLPSR